MPALNSARTARLVRKRKVAALQQPYSYRESAAARDHCAPCVLCTRARVIPLRHTHWAQVYVVRAPEPTPVPTPECQHPPARVGCPSLPPPPAPSSLPPPSPLPPLPPQPQPNPPPQPPSPPRGEAAQTDVEAAMSNTQLQPTNHNHNQPRPLDEAAHTDVEAAMPHTRGGPTVGRPSWRYSLRRV